MAAIITDELLKRYLQAKGRAWPNGWDVLRLVGRWEQREPEEVGATLGLCAAAEDRIVAAEEYRKAAAGMTQAGHLVESKLAITLAEAADDAATRFLEMAGVSRERWDDARKGEGR